MQKPRKIISGKEATRSMTIQENTLKKNILASRTLKILTSTPAWAFVEKEVKNSSCPENDITPDDLIGLFNKYFEMQRNSFIYNMAEGVRFIDDNTGLPDYHLYYWLDMNLNAYCQPEFNGILCFSNYYSLPTMIKSESGVSDVLNSRVNAPEPLASLCLNWKAERSGPADAPRKNKLLRFISTWGARDLERFMNGINLPKFDYSKAMNLNIKESPLFWRMFDDFKNEAGFGDLMCNFMEFKKILKSHTFLMEVVAIAFYHSLATLDEHQFLVKAASLNFSGSNSQPQDGEKKEGGEGEGENNEIKNFIDIIRQTTVAFIDIDPVSQISAMNNYYQKMFSYPAKELSEYD
jgi:hypothetical protein